MSDDSIKMFLPSDMAETSQQLTQLLDEMAPVAGALVYASMALLLLALVIVGLSFHPAFRIDGHSRGPGRWMSSTVRNLLLIVAAALVVTFSISLIEVPRIVGTLAIFNLFVMTLVLFVSRLIYIQDRFRIPVVVIAVLAAVGFSIFDLNDNHVVSPVRSSYVFDPTMARSMGFYEHCQTRPSDDFCKPRVPPKAVNGRLATSEFWRWFDQRADKDKYGDAPYPVFVVSAGGGGLYAAQFTAKFLARLQDHCPHFAQHVFAISGVLGGSVGAATFASLVRQEVKQTDKPGCRAFGKEEQGPLEQKTDFILGRDYLSPVIGSTLFPEFLQRFLPFPIQSFDRGKVIDRALEANVARALSAGDNPFEMPLQDLWDPKGVTPALMLNSTQPGTGRRVVMAPFDPRSQDAYAQIRKNMLKLEWLQQLMQAGSTKDYSEDLKLSTSAGVSARFPWLMLAASVQVPPSKDQQAKLIRLVDGGYFENSGADTAGDLIRTITRTQSGEPLPATYPKFQVVLLVLSGFETELAGDNTGATGDAASMGEILSPIRALLGMRESRTDLTVSRTFDYLCPDMNNCQSDFSVGWKKMHAAAFATLNLKDYEMPLSWHLSTFTRRFIGLHSGRPAECGNTMNATLPIWTSLQ